MSERNRTIRILHLEDDEEQRDFLGTRVKAVARDCNLNVRTRMVASSLEAHVQELTLAREEREVDIDLIETASALTARALVTDPALQPFDIVVSDLHLDDGDGWGVVFAAANDRFQPSATVIISSGTGSPSRIPPDGVLLLEKNPAHKRCIEFLKERIKKRR